MSESLRRRKVVESTAIAGAIGAYFPLHPDGPMLRSPCPFHDDRARGFRIDPAVRRFECRDCGASGDVVDFVRLYEGVTVSGALDLLEETLGP
jgi:DNA primase